MSHNKDVTPPLFNEELTLLRAEAAKKRDARVRRIALLRSGNNGPTTNLRKRYVFSYTLCVPIWAYILLMAYVHV